MRFSSSGLAFVFIAGLAVPAATGSATPTQQPITDLRQDDVYQATPIDAKEFITTATDSGKAEVTLAEMAQQKSQSDLVKQFAKMLEQDHTGANNELVRLAPKKGVTPSALSPSKREVIERLRRTEAPAFDRAYMTQMVEDHKKSVALYTRGTAGPDEDVKVFASRILPTIKNHLAEAETILKSLGSASPTTDRPGAVR
jgi:putative membrane protein